MAELGKCPAFSPVPHMGPCAQLLYQWESVTTQLSALGPSGYGQDGGPTNVEPGVSPGDRAQNLQPMRS